MLSPHHCQGQICSYVLKLQGDEEADFYIYCGYTKDIEKRMLAHTGIREGEQASFCKLHPPTQLLSVCQHSSEAEAVLAECANYNLWAGTGGDPQGPRPGEGRANQYGRQDALPTPGLATPERDSQFNIK